MGKKWRSKNVGEQSVNVVIELSESIKINGIDIGNEHSAFVEVQVGVKGANENAFKVSAIEPIPHYL